MFDVAFTLNGRQTRQNGLTFNSMAKCELSEAEVVKRMKNKNPSDEEINIAVQVIRKYPMARDIFVVETKAQSNSSKGGGEGAGVLLIIAFLLAVLFAPIVIILGMNGKFLLKKLYANVIGNEEFKKFKKPYATVGLIYWGISIVAFIVGIITKISALITIPLYVLLIGDIVYFIVGCVVGNKIYKKQINK